MPTQAPRVPDHVPSHLVYDFDRFDTPALYEVPQFGLAKRLREEAPPIFWSPQHGIWVVSKASFVAEILRRHDMFSSDPEFATWRKDMPTRVLPVAYDPPEHGEARRILAPMFTARAAVNMEAEIRALSAAVIDEVVADGGCEFIEQVSKVIPVVVFLRLANAPLDDREKLVAIVERYLHSADDAGKAAGGADLTDYLRGLVEQRRVTPGDDLISRLVVAEMDGRPLTEGEILGAAFLMFLAGLDTVAAALGFTMRFLARNPDHYRQLVENPAMIGGVVEEFLRIGGVAMPERAARDDFVYEGVQFRKCDQILLLSSISGMDADEVESPETVDFNRPISRHAIFGTGAHRCMGMHLARIEMRVVLEEWVKRIPTFRIAHDEPIETLGGVVWIHAALPLAWDVPEPARQAA